MSDLPWVKKGEQLIKYNSGYYRNAYFGWGKTETQMYGYIKGYKEAADLLVSNALDSRDISVLDTVLLLTHNVQQ